MARNIGADKVNAAMHAALDELYNQVGRSGVDPERINRVTLNSVRGRDSGEHVHASCVVRLPFSVSKQVSPPVDEDKFAG